MDNHESKFDRPLKVAYGSSRDALFWENREISFTELCEKLKETVRTGETADEYKVIPKPRRDAIKDKGGIVGGHLKNGRRKIANVLCRSLLILDIDYPDRNFLSRYREGHQYASAVYSTHSHTPEMERYRLLLPLSRDALPEEYEALARFISAEVGIECVDPCSYRANQLMYWQTTPSDGEYVFEVFDGDWLDPDALLVAHPDWRDATTLPVSSAEKQLVNKDLRHQQDPLSKDGIIGAFNNEFFPISKLLDTVLSGIYEPTGIENRYTHIGSTGTAGAVVYDDRFLYSHHATDPAYGRLLNAFDLMRVHFFGSMDERESMTEALRYASAIPAVQNRLNAMKISDAAADFTSLGIRLFPAPKLPDPIRLSDILTPPPKPPELISGILRKGHKMLIAGPSKAGKSFLLIELAIAIAEGRPWLGFPCAQGKVLYINLEIDPASCIDRFLLIYKRLCITKRRTDNIILWNLRGHALPLDKLTPLLIERMENEIIAAVIVDPIYKVITGDENNASEMGAFCNQFDKICTAMGASAIYCHHHSKGYQGSKKAMDRASGSGVFARDPDAQLDIIGLKKPQLPQGEEDDEEDFDEARSPWRMEASLREFPPIRSVNFFFDHPVHILDTDSKLATYHLEGSSLANLSMSSKRTSPEMRKRRLDDAFEAAPKGSPVTIRELADLAEVSTETIRRYLRECEDDYMVKNGVVIARPILSDS